MNPKEALTHIKKPHTKSIFQSAARCKRPTGMFSLQLRQKTKNNNKGKLNFKWKLFAEVLTPVMFFCCCCCRPKMMFVLRGTSLGKHFPRLNTHKIKHTWSASGGLSRQVSIDKRSRQTYNAPSVLVSYQKRSKNNISYMLYTSKYFIKLIVYIL